MDEGILAYRVYQVGVLDLTQLARDLGVELGDAHLGYGNHVQVVHEVGRRLGLLPQRFRQHLDQGARLLAVVIVYRVLAGEG